MTIAQTDLKTLELVEKFRSEINLERLEILEECFKAWLESDLPECMSGVSRVNTYENVKTIQTFLHDILKSES
ncbi:MAG: hypothetical protein IT264_00085 [Saprospiraceae bacterium]|nr:hypothetical protein [Saprospiraceae bacterium]